MQQAERKQVRQIELFPDLDMVLLGLLASLTVQAFRVGVHEYQAVVWIEALVLMAVPMLLFWFVKRTAKTSRAKILQDRSTIYYLQAGAIAMLVLFGLVQWCSRLLGAGDANEIVALLMVSYLAWYLIVFSKFGTFARAGFVLACSLVLFVCCTADSIAVFVWAFFYAIFALWWLLGNYWSRVNSKALDGTSETLSISGAALAITMLVVSLTGLLVWSIVPSDSVFFVKGFAPFSGGTDGTQDPYAFKGVGDGDNLAAGEDASTTGAVDSDQFIEDHEQSIYDMVSETYSGPMEIKKEQNRAVALKDKAKHMHDVIKSEQSGKSFRTVRKPPVESKRKLESRVSKALFYVEGSVPARFTMDCFQEFDGWDWSKVTLGESDSPKAPIALKTLFGKPWYVVESAEREYLSQRRSHRIKVMRLKSKTLPACSTAERWHIYQVNLLDLFDWNEQGVISIDSSGIPPQTMIDVVSRVPNYHTMRSTRNLLLVDHPNPMWESIDTWLRVGSKAGTSKGLFEAIETEPDSAFVQMPENSTSTELKTLVAEITKGHRRGWNQVEAIVNHFREQYEHDPERVASAEGEDSIASFLGNGGGPSYLFASSATQALRAAEYRTRLASGFLIQHKDFDRRANQSIVTGDNLHMWPEVCLDGWNWIPVEPNPDFPIPLSHQTIWQMAKSAVFGFFNLAIRNPIATLFLVAIVALTSRFWAEINAAVSWLAWSIMLLASPKRQLAATRRMLDTRFRVAGIPRPQYATISDWFLKVDQDVSQEFFNFWQRQNFSAQPTVTQRDKIRSACRQASSDLSLRKIKNFAKQMTKADS